MLDCHRDNETVFLTLTMHFCSWKDASSGQTTIGLDRRVP